MVHSYNRLNTKSVELILGVELIQSAGLEDMEGLEPDCDSLPHDKWERSKQLQHNTNLPGKKRSVKSKHSITYSLSLPTLLLKAPKLHDLKNTLIPSLLMHANAWFQC